MSPSYFGRLFYSLFLKAYPFIFQKRHLFDFYMQVCKTEVTKTRSKLYSHTLLYAMTKT